MITKFAEKSNAQISNVSMGCQRCTVRGSQPDSMEDAIKHFKNCGMTLCQCRTIGQNLFATLSSESGTVSLSYLNYNHTLSAVYDPLEGRKIPPLKKEAYESITKPQAASIGLVSDEAIKEGNGMCLVMTLSDGSYIVYDGGYYDDAEGLLCYLEGNNKRNERPRIALWVLTHSHIDHFLAMDKISKEYTDRVTVEKFMMNPRDKSYEFEQYDPYLGEKFAKEVLCRFEGAKLIKPHMGQVIFCRDAEIEILHTQEELPPSKLRWMNETSLVTRIYLGRSSILLPADAELGVDVTIPAIYGDSLKSDILQQAHHACSGGSYTFYDLVSPHTVFWTCSKEKYDKYTAHWYNNGYNYYLKNMAKENYHSGCGNITIPM